MASTADSIASRGKNSPLRRRILSCAKSWPLSVFAGLPAVCCCVGVAARSTTCLLLLLLLPPLPTQRSAQLKQVLPTRPDRLPAEFLYLSETFCAAAALLRAPV